MRDTKDDKLCLKFLEKVKENRQKIISDVKNTTPDLYFVLRTSSGLAKHDIYSRLYDLSWFQSLWKSLQPIFEWKDLSFQNKKNLAEWYIQFLGYWEFSSLGKNLISEEMKILRNMLLMDNKWEENTKRLEERFLKMKSELEKMKKNLQEEE